MSASIKVNQDSNGRLSEVDISELGKRHLKVSYIYTSDGLQMIIKGNKDLLPSYADLLKIIDAKFTRSVDVINEQPFMEDLTWLSWYLDGSYAERWEYGFDKRLYHGRTRAYFKSEAAKAIPYANFTLPEILPAGTNTIGIGPWNRAIRVRNENPSNPGVMDELYVGFPKAHFRQLLAFEGLLPDVGGGKPDQLYIGFEVNSGGSFALLNCLTCLGGAWKLHSVNYGNIPAIDKAVTLNYPGAWSRYAILYDPPKLEFWQSTVANILVLEKAASTDLTVDANAAAAIRGKCIPFFANEDGTAFSQFLIGDIWAHELEYHT